MSDVLISIITTVKNGEAHILETLQNIRKQTFRGVEHIVVDDGSVDGTIEIIKEFQREHPEYPLQLHSCNLGRGRALNFAVSRAKADWIAIIDADDIWHPQKLEIQYKVVNTTDIDVLATESAVCFDNFNDVVFEVISGEGDINVFKTTDLLRSNRINHSSVIIKKSLCNYDEQRSSQFDYELWLRLIRTNKKIAKSTLLLAYRRIHSQQSFEGKMKKMYRWRSYKLKAGACIRNRDVMSLFYNTFKLVFDMVIPRQMRFKVRERLKTKK